MKKSKKVVALAAVMAVACVAMVGVAYAAYTGTTTGKSTEIPVQYVTIKLGDNSVGSYTETFQFEDILYDTQTIVDGNAVKTQYKAQSDEVTSEAVAVVIDDNNNAEEITLKVKLAAAYASGDLSIQFYSDDTCATAVGDAITLSTSDQAVNVSLTGGTYYCKITLTQNGISDWSDNVPSEPDLFSVVFTAEVEEE